MSPVQGNGHRDGPVHGGDQLIVGGLQQADVVHSLDSAAQWEYHNPDPKRKIFLLDQLKQGWNVAQGVQAVQQNHEVDKCMFEREQSPRIGVLSSPVMLIVIKRSTNK